MSVKKAFSIILIVGLFFLPAGCGKTPTPGSETKNSGTENTEILVSAAASLKDALEELKPVYEKAHPGVSLVYNMGSSGTLQQQIEQGSPVDLFLSAGKKQMDALQKKGLIKNESRIDLLGNVMVLITSKENKSIRTFADLAKPEVIHIGIGNPDSVPAGKYGQEVLATLKLWDSLQPKLVQAKDVRQVLAYVETGNAEAGLVYQSDTVISNKVKVAAVAPTDSHSPIVYPAAVISSARHAEEAQKFLAYLQGKEAAGVFEKYGFKLP